MTGGGDGSAWARASLGEDVTRRPGSHNIATHSALAPEPVACAERRGPTPIHPEPGRETQQRRRYWRDARWERRSVRLNTAAWSSGSSSGS